MFNKHLTLKQYRKKYRRYLPYLLKFHKSEVKKFDFDHEYYNLEAAKGRFNLDKFVLDGRKFILIGDTYYEIPRPFTSLWLKTLNKPTKATAAAVILAGVVFGILKGTNVIFSDAPTYSVTFDCGDGFIESEHIKTIGKQTVIEVSPNPKKDGFRFDGWWKKRDTVGGEYVFSDKVSFPLKLEGNLTLYSKWVDKNEPYTVTLKYDDKYLNPVKVARGGNLEKTETPIKKDYTFKYWTLDGEKIELPYKVEKDITLEAYFEQSAFTVTFNTDGTKPEGTEGSEPGPYTLSHLEKLDYEPITEKNDKTFLGWSTTTSKDDLIKYPYEVKNNQTLNAIWGEGRNYKVTFDSNDGSGTQTTFDCSHISTPPVIKRTDYRLLGWSTSPSGELIDFSIAGGYQVTKDQTLYAQWERSQFFVELYDGSTKKETREHVVTIDEAPNIVKKDFEIFSWYRDEELKNEIKKDEYPLDVSSELKTGEDTFKMYAKYERNAYKVDIIDDNQTTIVSYSSVSTLDSKLKPDISRDNYTPRYYVGTGESKTEITNFESQNIKSVYGSYLEEETSGSGDKNLLKINVEWVQTAYTLTLIYPNGAPYEKKELLNQKVVILDNLEVFDISGYKFSHWSEEKGGEKIEGESITLTSDKTLYAVYVKEALTLNISYKCGETVVADPTSISSLDSSTQYNINIIPKEETIIKDDIKYGYCSISINGTKIDTDTFTLPANVDSECIVEYVQCVDVKLYLQINGVKQTNPYATLEDQYKIDLSTLPDPGLTDYVVTKYLVKDEEKTGTITINDLDLSNPEIVVVMTQNCFTVKLNAKSGSVAVDKLEHIKSGSTLAKTQIGEISSGTLKPTSWHTDPSLSTESKFIFSDEATAGETATVITGDLTLYAKYDQTSNTTVHFTLTQTDYDAGARFVVNDVEIADLYVDVISAEVGSIDYGSINYKNHALKCWKENDEAVETFPISDGGEHTFVAEFYTLAEACSIQMNAGNGTFKDGSKTKLYTVNLGTTFKDFVTAHSEELTTIYTNYEFSYWGVYDASKKTYVQISDDYNLSSDLFIYAQYVDQIDTEGSKATLATSNWATFSYYANQGLTKLKEFYKFKTETTEETLVDQTRTVTYNGVSKTVRIIAEGHDYEDIQSSTPTGQTAVTFAFDEAITLESYGTSTITETYMPNRWSDSVIRSKLDGTVSELFDEQLTKNVKTVEKKTMKGGNGDDYGTYIYTNDKFFLFSAYELNISTNTLKDYVFTDATSKTADNVGKEGTPYTYFSTDNLRRRKYNENYVEYWIRSPYNSNESTWGGEQGSLINSITSGGTINNTSVSEYYKYWYPDRAEGLVPGFAVGVYKVS